MRVKIIGLLIMAGVLLLITRAYAWHSGGCIYCDYNENGEIDSGDLPLQGVVVKIVSTDGTFSATATTDRYGCFYIALPDDSLSYVQTLDPDSLPGGAGIITPNGGKLEFTLGNGGPEWIEYDWLVECGDAHIDCWLTGGGSQKDNVTGEYLAEKGPSHSFGGNVYPACDPDPGNGGSWNHVAHHDKLHFHATDIEVVRCGNIDGIPPGSESPVTPVNFIEFKGFGWLHGIKGNKDSWDKVYFFAHCQDRNEPGSTGAKDGSLVDRYFLHVFEDPSDPAGTTLLLLDEDGDPETVDPVLITRGNLQLHASSCTN